MKPASDARERAFDVLVAWEIERVEARRRFIDARDRSLSCQPVRCRVFCDEDDPSDDSLSPHAYFSAPHEGADRRRIASR